MYDPSVSFTLFFLRQKFTTLSSPSFLLNSCCFFASLSLSLDLLLFPFHLHLSKKGGERMAKDRGVRPDCPNASNPFHICAVYCSHGAPPRSTIPANKERSVAAIPNGVGSKENREKVEGGRRNVDPLCVNASNPFHRCAEYCSRRSSDGKFSPKGIKLDGKKERVVMSDNRNVNPSCPNASNPFHQCADYCSQRTTVIAGGNIRSSSNGGGSSRGSVTVLERKDVDPRCANASNPFHKCAEYCSQRINGVVS